MKGKKTKIILLGALLVAIVGVVIYFVMKYKTYQYTEVNALYISDSTDHANYKQCFDGILRYNRDGIALVTEQGSEIWNQSYQMNNPVIEMCGDSVAVADKGGTSIYVFQKKGLKGEIKTTKTIEKFCVSSQGIVSVILKDEKNPLVMCYDAAGNKLVEHKVIPQEMGYPIDVAISEDGKTILVSYLYTGQNEASTKIAYYYFGDDNTEKVDYQVHQQEFAGTIIPTTAFMQKDVSILVSDNALIFYKGLKEPKESLRINFDSEIQCVGYDENLVAVMLKNGGDASYKLNIYNKKGKMLSSIGVDNEFSHIKVANNQVMVYDGQSCGIYLKNGVCKYRGNIDQSIMEMYPAGGINKYIVINTSGFYEVRLAN